MAVSFAAQTIHDGPRNLVVKLQLVGDGTDVTALLLINVSDYSGPTPGVGASVKVMRVQWQLDNFIATLLWDATTDVEFLTLEGEGDRDFSAIGGLINNSGTGIPGDIMLTTVGNAATEDGTIILWMKKRDI